MPREKKKKVIHFCSSDNLFGPEKTVINESIILQSLGYDVKIINITSQKENSFIIRVKESGLTGEDYVSNAKISLGLFKYLIRDLKKSEKVVLHSHGYKADFHGLISAKFNSTPIVTTVHGFTSENTRVVFYESVQKHLLPYFDQVICVSDYYRKFVSRKTHIDDGKVITVHNGIKLEDYQEVRKSYYEEHFLNHSRNSKRLSYKVGVVGRLSKEKGHDKLLDIIEMLNHLVVRVECYIVGDGELMDYLKSLVKKRRLSSCVFFTGHVQKPIDFYKLFDLLFITSIREGLPNVVLEAMAIGIPVISFDICGIKEVIREGINGFLVKPFNTREFALKAKGLLEDISKRRFLSDNAYALIKKEFTFENRMEQIIDIYEAFLEGDTLHYNYL